MPKHREKLEDKVLSVICEETRFRITRLRCEKVSDLTSTQEDADTRRQLSLLMIQTSSFCILASPMIFLVPYIKKRGTQSRTWFFVVGKVARALGHDICDALIGVHAFMSCDTVSACAGRGKMRIFKHVKTNKTYEEAFCWLGRT